MTVHASVAVSVFAILLASGCGGAGPDLFPEPRAEGSGSEALCRREGSRLVVRVRNQATGDNHQETTTVVTFSQDEPKSVQTKPMPAGSFTDVMFDIPPECFAPDCSFKITVDADEEVEESDETNNTASGVCIG